MHISKSLFHYSWILTNKIVLHLDWHRMSGKHWNMVIFLKDQYFLVSLTDHIDIDDTLVHLSFILGIQARWHLGLDLHRYICNGPMIDFRK